MQLEKLNISFSQMYYFIQVAEHQNISTASKILNVTPSTVSKSILTLEQNLEMQLFYRGKKSLKLTDVGQYLYREWKGILDELEETLEQAHSYGGEVFRSIRIGVLDSHRSEAYLLEYLNKFYDEYPDYRVFIESDPPEILHQKLQNGEFDIIFTVRYDVEQVGWEGYRVFKFNQTPLVVCMRPDNPLTNKEELDVIDLKELNLIIISSLHVPSYGKMLTRICQEYGFRPNSIYNTTSANSQIYNLRTPNDVFICDRFHRDYGTEGMLFKVLRNTASGVAMVWKPDDSNKVLNAFLSIFSI